MRIFNLLPSNVCYYSFLHLATFYVKLDFFLENWNGYWNYPGWDGYGAWVKGQRMTYVCIAHLQLLVSSSVEIKDMSKYYSLKICQPWEEKEHKQILIQHFTW